MARFALLIVGGFSVVSTLLPLAVPGVRWIMTALAVANCIAMATGFYSGMLYIRWLAPRIRLT